MNKFYKNPIEKLYQKKSVLVENFAITVSIGKFSVLMTLLADRYEIKKGDFKGRLDAGYRIWDIGLYGGEDNTRFSKFPEFPMHTLF